MLYPTFKITKPIRLITLFSGYDSQALALKYLGVNFEHYKTCEWAVKSIQALKDLHFEEDKKDYSKGIEIEQIKEFLLNKGISSNYNDPMTQAQINRLGEKQARTIYNNIQATHNLVDIQQTKGKDLCIKDKDKFTYLLTYSFPCQDLSLAGKRQGMSDTTTRSGLLWEVERILMECRELNQLPDVLLMENVIQVHGEGAKEDFNKWQLRLEELGYKNYWKDLIATDYGIPQTRNRCFMISILGDYNYTFPKPIPLKLKLKNMLENNVDEKYFLSDKMMEYITSKDNKYKVNENNLNINRSIACSKTTREGNTRADTTDYICDELPENFNIKNGCKQVYDLNYYNHEQSNRVYSPEYSSPTLRTKHDEAGTIKVTIGNKALNETLEQNEIDDTCYIDTYNRKIDKDKSGTITTGVSFRNNTFLADSDLRIRKLTPKECFRLMGVKDEDYDKVAKNQSDSSLYHLAGDSIVCQGVLTSIFKEMM